MISLTLYFSKNHDARSDLFYFRHFTLYNLCFVQDPFSCRHSDRGIFCTRTLNLRSISAIGYDMDYTLMHYNVMVIITPLLSSKNFG